MTSRVIRESYDGGSIAVDTRFVGNVHDAAPQVVLNATERGMSSTRLHMTPNEVDELIAALQAARAERAPTDTRSPVTPVADDRGAGHSGTAAAVPGCTAVTP